MNDDLFYLSDCERQMRLELATPSWEYSALSTELLSLISSEFAEKIGFEPTKPFRGLHAFQACLFNHSSTSPFDSANSLL